jgi:hypothetical protein
MGALLGNQVGRSFPGPLRDKYRRALEMERPFLWGICEENLEGGSFTELSK